MPPIHYFVLSIVITISVASGNLISNYVSAKYAAYELRQELAKAEEEAALIAAMRAENNAKAQKIRTEHEEKERTNSKKGISLKRSCSDWKRMNAQKDSEVSRKEMKRSCDAYLRYIKTGR